MKLLFKIYWCFCLILFFIPIVTLVSLFGSWLCRDVFNEDMIKTLKEEYEMNKDLFIRLWNKV